MWAGRSLLCPSTWRWGRGQSWYSMNARDAKVTLARSPMCWRRWWTRCVTTVRPRTPTETVARAFPPKYTLTRICSVEYTKSMESLFEIIAEPNRRAILSLLVSSQQSVGEIERQLRMPQPMASKHLRVLREAGFVESTVDAQRRLYRLKPEALEEVDAWLAPFRRLWSAHVDALERHLDRIEHSTPPKRKTRRTYR